MTMYKVYRYYGGERPQNITWAKTYAEAENLGLQAEHFEIEEVKLKKYSSENKRNKKSETYS